MAYASGAAQKDHRAGNALLQNHAIVTGAADHGERSNPDAANSICRQLAHTGIHGHRELIHEHFTCNGKAAPRRDRRRLGKQAFHGPVTSGVICVSNVETGAQLPGDYISRAGVGAQIADGGHEARRIESPPLHFDYPLRRARYRILAQPHRRRARVTSPAGEGDFCAGLAGNCMHHAER